MWALFLEPIVALFDLFDGVMFFQEIVLLVVEIGDQCECGLAKTGALEEWRVDRNEFDQVDYRRRCFVAQRFESKVWRLSLYLSLG